MLDPRCVGFEREAVSDSTGVFIEYPVSNIEHPISSIEHPASNICILAVLP